MWRLADRQLDEFLHNGECEFISEYSKPFATLVIADLLGVPEEDHASLLARRGLSQMPGSKPGVVTGEKPVVRTSGHNTLEVFYDYFSEKIAQRRAQPPER